MPNFLFVLSKDDNEAVTRCCQFAKIAHSKGHHVHREWKIEFASVKKNSAPRWWLNGARWYD